jgi:hypothetical protein
MKPTRSRTPQKTLFSSDQFQRDFSHLPSIFQDRPLRVCFNQINEMNQSFLASRSSRFMHGDFSKCESYTSTQQAEDKPGLSGLSGLFGLSRVFG